MSASLTQAVRTLLGATASLPGAASLPTVRAIHDARKAVVEALEMASRERVPNRGARMAPEGRTAAWVALRPPEPVYWPSVSASWHSGAREVRLYRRAGVGPANVVPVPGSIACRTKVTPPVPSLMGWWSCFEGGAYRGHVLIYRGDPMDKPPAAKVAAVYAKERE